MIGKNIWWVYRGIVFAGRVTLEANETLRVEIDGERSVWVEKSRINGVLP